MDILEALNSGAAASQPTPSPSTRRTVQTLIEQLFESGRFSDVTFLIGRDQEPIKAHRLILVSRSSVFETMFSDFWAAPESDRDNYTVLVPDAEPDSFRWFLRFLYTDNADNLTAPIDILYLGQKYDVKEVVAKCADHLATTIDLKTVIEVHEAAKLFDLQDLQRATMNFMLTNGEDLIKSEEFLKLDVATVTEILASEALVVCEITVFKAVVMWAIESCDRQGVPRSPENLRLAAESLIKLVRFPTMTPQFFANEIVPTNFLTGEDIIKIFVYFSSHELTVCRNPHICAPFVTSPRTCQAKEVNRVIDCAEVGVYLCSASCSPTGLAYTVTGNAGKLHEEALDFIVDRSVEIIGVGFFGPDLERLRNTDVLKTYKVDIQLFNYELQNEAREGEHLRRSLVSRVNHTVGTRSDYNVEFLNPIKVASGKIHHIRIAFKGQETRHGVTRLTNVTTICKRDESVTFNFVGPIPIVTNQHPGRIRSLIFKMT